MANPQNDPFAQFDTTAPPAAPTVSKSQVNPFAQFDTPATPSDPSRPAFRSDPYRGPAVTDPLSSIGAGFAGGIGKSAIGAQQLLTNLLVQPALPGQNTGLNRLISGVRNAPKSEMSAVQGYEAPYSAAHPFLTGAGDVGGQIAAAAAVPEGDAGTAASWLGRAAQAARTGTIAGAEQYVPESDYWKNKAEETAANIGGSSAFGQLGEIPVGIGKFMDKYSPEAAKNYAVQRVISTIKDGEESGYVQAKDIAHLFHTAHAAGVPMTLMESGGPPLQSLAGWVSRTPGAPEATIRGSFDTRLSGARESLLDMFKRNFDSPETRRQTSRALRSAQMAASKPLYEKLFKPSSISSVAKQFEKGFSENTANMKAAMKESQAAEQRFQAASSTVSRGKSHVYMNSPELQEMKAAQADAEAAAQKVKGFEKQKEDLLSQMRAAHQSQANGEIGAVYSPHIARMLAEPVVQQGVREGMKIQRMEAATQNIPFDPNDYGVKYKTNSEDEIPEITKTPNMRLLDAGKRGLDKILNSYRDPDTGKLPLNDETVRTIDNLRRAWISELDRINPHYKPARDAYAGPAALLNALHWGEKIMGMHPEDVKSMFDDMSESEKEHFRKGAAQAYSDYVKKPNFMGSELGAVAQEDELADARERLQPIFKTKSQLNDFMDSVTGWKAIKDARQTIVGGTQSAARLEASAAHNAASVVGAASAALQAASGHVGPAISKTSKLLSRFDPTQTKKVKTEIAKILTNKDIKLSQAPGEVLDMPQTPIPPGKISSIVGGASPIMRALGAKVPGMVGSMFSNQ